MHKEKAPLRHVLEESRSVRAHRRPWCSPRVPPGKTRFTNSQRDQSSSARAPRRCVRTALPLGTERRVWGKRGWGRERERGGGGFRIMNYWFRVRARATRAAHLHCFIKFRDGLSFVLFTFSLIVSCAGAWNYAGSCVLVEKSGVLCILVSRFSYSFFMFLAKRA